MTDSSLFDQEEKALQRYQQLVEDLDGLNGVCLHLDEVRCEQIDKLATLKEGFGEMLRDYKKIHRQSSRLVKLGDLQQEKIAETNKALARSQQQLEQQNLELRAAAELREDVDRIMRHDLKSPLNAVIGLSDILLKSVVMDDQQSAMCKMVLDAGYTLLAMINHSLDLYKMERGSYEFKPDTINILPLIRKIRDSNISLLRANKTEMEILLDGRIPEQTESLSILGEALLCFSMLSNLVKNAIEASPEGERITLSLSSGAMVEMAIHNKGSVPMAIRERFFDKYVTTGKRQGTGLGTYSARRMAETQNGTIHLDTSDEEGTTVMVRMPASPG